MHFLQRAVIATVTIVFVSAGAAIANGFNGSGVGMIFPESHKYTGSWPVTVSHAARGNGTYCLTLRDTGSGQTRHSGSAAITGNGTSQPFGTFLVINRLLVATIQQPGGYQDAGLLYIVPANNGTIGNGIFEQVYGGEDFDAGVLTIGMKGGC